mmetsp:Transcript_9235/g.13483  ORF Transcript_9235/g.13483 Transcript_9235/m.13483 type:complete len:227 (-) Transcript_9235:2713-3393(-)
MAFAGYTSLPAHLYIDFGHRHFYMNTRQSMTHHQASSQLVFGVHTHKYLRCISRHHRNYLHKCKYSYCVQHFGRLHAVGVLSSQGTVHRRILTASRNYRHYFHTCKYLCCMMCCNHLHVAVGFVFAGLTTALTVSKRHHYDYKYLLHMYKYLYCVRLHIAVAVVVGLLFHNDCHMSIHQCCNHLHIAAQSPVAEISTTSKLHQNFYKSKRKNIHRHLVAWHTAAQA